jgi:hypothetical protein
MDVDNNSMMEQLGFRAVARQRELPRRRREFSQWRAEFMKLTATR